MLSLQKWQRLVNNPLIRQEGVYSVKQINLTSNTLVFVRTKYKQIPVPRKLGRVNAISTYPITSPRLNQPTVQERSENAILKLEEQLEKKTHIDYNEICNAMMTAPTRAQLDTLYNIAKKSNNEGVNVHNAYISHLSNIGFPEEALQVYQKLMSTGFQPGTKLHSTLTSIYAKLGKIDEALAYMKDLQADNIRLETRAYRAIMHYYFDLGEMRKGFNFFEETVASGVQPDLVLLNALMRGYRMCGFTDKLEETYNRIRELGLRPDAMTHTERVISYGKTKDMETMLLRLQQMKDDGVQPTRVTYNAMVWILLKNRQYESASAILETMTRERQLPMEQKAIEILAHYYADRHQIPQAKWILDMAKKEGHSTSHMRHLLEPAYGYVDESYWKDPVNRVVEWPY